jgi:hypothetical protein
MKVRRNVARLASLVAVCALAAVEPAPAQTLPSEPIVFADGHVTVGGDVSASVGPSDPGFFNYTDYQNSAMRLVLVNVSAALKLGGHFALLGEVRSENADSPRPYAYYLRFRPWTARAIDIQVGRVPPTFGAFARRTYASDNLLIGYPLAYQYLISLRPDSLPVNADELLSMRGSGWLSRFSIGNTALGRGVPLASVFSWDTGVQVHAATDLIEATAAVTTGTVSNPLLKDDNSGRQVAGRVVLHPAVGLVIGGSAARGPFVTATAARGAVGEGHDGEFTQTALGADIEYSRSYYLIRLETLVSQWKLPAVRAPLIRDPLTAAGTSLEGRYKISPGLYAAARLDHLAFSTVTGSQTREPWEAPVTRVEVGGGYSIQRNLLLKVSVQYNTRDTVLDATSHPVAAQLIFWF